MVDKSNFIKTNGFSNKFWDWGGEDTDLQNRANIKNIPINRDNFVLRREQIKKNLFIIADPKNHTSKAKKLNHGNSNLRNILKKKYDLNKNNIKKDGITTCKYNVIKSEILEKNVNKIIVDI